MQEPRKYLLELGLSDSEITVYLTMLQGVYSASEIIKTTELKRPTVYYALGCLEKRGLVSKTGREGEKRFFAEPAEKLAVLVDEKVHEVAKLKDNITELIPFFTLSSTSKDTKPTVTFYEGSHAVQGVIMEMLYNRKKHIDSIIPKENFFWQLGSDFVEHFVKERTRRKITTRNLWEVETKKSTFREYYKEYSEVKILPSVMHERFETSIFIYDSTTLYISSKKNSYAVIITSEEHTKTMLALFDGLWITSAHHTV